MTSLGITGGLCAGKTTVAEYFKKVGAEVVDADKIVHRLYRCDKKIRRAVTREFGNAVVTRGMIDRSKLAKIAFGNKRNLKRLCSVVHPAVLKIIKAKIRKAKKSVIVVDAPLLVETGLYRYVDYVVVVKATRNEQLKRCKTKKYFLRRLAAQMPLSEKLAHADFVIDNSRSKKYTEIQVRKIWEKIKGGKDG